MESLMDFFLINYHYCLEIKNTINLFVCSTVQIKILEITDNKKVIRQYYTQNESDEMIKVMVNYPQILSSNIQMKRIIWFGSIQLSASQKINQLL